MTKTAHNSSQILNQFESYVILYMTKTQERCDKNQVMFESYVILYMTKTSDSDCLGSC